MCRELIYSIVIALSLIFVLVTPMRPWVAKVHQSCLAGHQAKNFREGWRSRCERNIKPGDKNKDHLPIYIISAATNAVTKARSHIWFGPNYPNGHPSAIHYDTTMNKADSMAVMFAWNESIFLEATDYGTEYFIEIKTPDRHSASCYKLVDDRNKNITLARDAKC